MRDSTNGSRGSALILRTVAVTHQSHIITFLPQESCHSTAPVNRSGNQAAVFREA